MIEFSDADRREDISRAVAFSAGGGGGRRPPETHRLDGAWWAEEAISEVSQRWDFEADATGLSANALGDVISATHQSLRL
jgi:hypothetical protein